MQKFDLTSKTGILSMIASICSNNTMSVLVNLLKTLLTQNNTENQKKAIIEIIKEGKDNGAEELEIIADRGISIDFSSPIEGTEIKVKGGDDSKMQIKVKYK